MKKGMIHPLVVFLLLATVAGCSKKPDERLMQKGNRLEEKEKYSEAVMAYEKIIKRYPHSPLVPEALYRTGLVYNSGMNDSQKAILMLQKVVDEYPENSSAAECQFMIGFIYANNIADTAKARVAYTAFLRKYPDHELAPSAQWELKYMGKNVNEIPELREIGRDLKIEVGEHK